MKNIMWKYYKENNTQKCVDVLSSMVEKYNNIYHRSIKLIPSDARTQQTINTYTMHSMLKLMLEKLHHLNSMLVITYA